MNIRFVIALIASIVIATDCLGQDKPDRVVLGYSACWRDAVTPPEDYDFSALTHLARAFLHPNPDGTVEVPPNYFDPRLETLAHQHGVKLLMSAGGEADDANNWVSIASHPQYLKHFLDTLDQLMAEHHYDGVDVDWEPAPLTTDEGDAYTSFLKALRARFPHAILTTALPPSEYWVSHMSWDDVMASVDYVNVMTYDYAGGWGGIAGHGSNLFPPGDYAPTPGYSVAEGMQNLLQNHHLPPNKLLMGMTFWGYRFRADHIGGSFPAHAHGYADGVTYEQAQDLFRTGHYLSAWDQAAQMPYLQRTGGGSVVCYENPESIRRKCEYAKKLGVAGVMIWHVGADESGSQAPLMDAVALSCGVKPAVLGASALQRQIADLSHALDRHDRDSQTPAPATEPASDLSRLETQLAHLRLQSGLMEDDHWMAAALRAANP